MPIPPRHSSALEGTRGRILSLIRRQSQTANELGARLGMTHNAVRGHLAALQHEGLIREGGLQRSTSRPSVIYELVPEAESIFSRAYIPFVGHLVRVLGERLSQDEMDDVMHTVGRRLATDWPRLHGNLEKRLDAASALLADLGAAHEVEKLDGGYVIRGYGCLLAKAVQGRPEVCRAVEGLLAEMLEVPVRECCQHGERPRCCFEVGVARDASDSARARRPS